MSLCLACGATNPLDIKFCTRCGVKLQIQDRYRALRIIGQGGFGKTYLAQDDGKPSKPKCVIKQFSYDDPQSLRKAVELFEQEAVRLDDLGHHDQIPELLAHCEQDGQQYLVQEFIDGENLLQELNRQGKFNEAKIKGLLLDLLPVLQFIHAGNVIHRDIKPANIIRRRSDGKLVLVDFGAAKMASKTALAKTGTTIGSAEYTSPEQARGKAVFASDIYALGVTCLYLLTQVSPFDMFSDHEGRWVWRDFLSGNGVSDGLGKIIDRMVDQTLARRYQTASDVLAVLQPQTSSPTSVQLATLDNVKSIEEPPFDFLLNNYLNNLKESNKITLIKSFRYANIWRRWIAFMIDAGISFLIVLVSLGISYIIFRPMLELHVENAINNAINSDELDQRRRNVKDISLAISIILPCVNVILYHVISEISPRRATLGKWIMGLQVTNIYGNKIGFFRSLFRFVLKLAVIVYLVGVIYLPFAFLFSKRKQGIHDFFARTIVIRKQKQV